MSCATLPPSIAGLLEPHHVPTLTTLVCAGEACPARLAETWASSVRFINAYGPTEATVCATMSHWRPGDPLPPPIGRPMTGVDARVVRDDDTPVARGDDGELLLAGPGLALGYWRRPDETARRFISGPGGERWYRTGDRVRELPDGQLVFLGRLDEQVKVAGYRIEIGEIRACLDRTPAVDSCEVVVERAPDGDRIIAFVRLVRPASDSELLAVCRAELPPYMVPVRILEVSVWPTTPNGKIDRGMLLEQLRRGAQPRSMTSSVEHVVADVWQEVLGGSAEGASADADFWSVGGTSLRLMALLARLEDVLGVELAPANVLGEPLTLSRLTALVGNPQRRDGWRGGLILNDGAPGAVFLLPPVTGDPFGMLHLGRALARHRRVVCLAGCGWFDGEPAASVEAHARYYREQIARVSSEQRIVLIGYSLGGTHAFEVAQQLVHAGCEPHLAIIEGPAAYSRVRTDLIEKMGNFALKPTAMTLARLLTGTVGQQSQLTMDALAQADDDGVVAALGAELERVGVIGRTSLPAMRRRLDLFGSNLRALFHYVGTSYDRDLLQVLSEDGHPFVRDNGAQFDWTPWLDPARYIVIRVPGDHLRVIDAQHAATTAAALEPYIAKWSSS